MLIRHLDDCLPFVSGDQCLLREYLHPGKHPTAIRYSLALATVEPGAASTPHTLSATEVYFIISGTGRMHVGGETAEAVPMQAIYIQPGATQWIENTGQDNLVFICIVDPPWTPEMEEVHEGGAGATPDA